MKIITILVLILAMITIVTVQPFEVTGYVNGLEIASNCSGEVANCSANVACNLAMI